MQKNVEKLNNEISDPEEMDDNVPKHRPTL